MPINKRKTTEQFISEAINIHGNQYNYSKVVYAGAFTKVEIICPVHGSFYQAPCKHVAQHTGCPKCRYIKNGQANRKSVESFIVSANKVHHNKYDYSKVHYTTCDTKVEIICNTHGSFWQTPDKHVHGKTQCPKCGRRKCGRQKITNEQFVGRAHQVHGNTYDYSLVNIQSMKQKVCIMCRYHGLFYQLPSNHLSKHNKNGCPQCITRISKGESEWLDSLAIPTENRQVRLTVGDNTITADAFDATTNTIYEYYGDYWHGNPQKFDSSDINKTTKKSFGQLYQATIVRREMLLEHGFTVVEMWENDWNKLKNSRM